VAQPRRVGRLSGDEAGPVVADLERHLVPDDLEGHPGLACPGVLGHVDQGLLGDPVQDRLLGSGQPGRQLSLDGAGDPGLLVEGGGVVAERRHQSPLVQRRGT
jgi:hypothetical protein